MGSLGGRGVGFAQTEQRGDFLHAGRGGSRRLKSQSVVGRMPIAGAGGAPAISALEGEGAKHGREATRAVVGLGQERLLADRAVERLARGQHVRGGAQDREQLGLGGLRPGLHQIVGDE